MHRWVTSLWHAHKDKPIFVVGNGKSKELYDIRKLREKGPIIACNYAYKFHPVDYLTFRDIVFTGAKNALGNPNIKLNVFETCVLEFEGPKIMPFMRAGFRYGKNGRQYFSKKLEALCDMQDDIYYFHWQRGHPYGRNRSEPDFTKNVISKGSSGLQGIMLAYIMGGNPIILVGMDCCALEGEKSSNAYYADATRLKVPMGNLMTTRHLKRSYLANMRFNKRHRHETQFLKLGNYGLMEIPWTEPEKL